MPARADGSLYLPYVHDATVDAVSETAALCGVSLSVTKPCSVEVMQGGSALSDFAGRPVVVALGVQPGCEAARFAALTGRPLLDLDVAAAATPNFWQFVSAATSVTLVAPADWDATALTAMLSARRSVGGAPPIGLLFPFGEIAREAALLKAVVLTAVGCRAPGYRFLFPLDRDRLIVREGDVVAHIGPSVDIDDLIGDLSRPFAFTFGCPHSNGMNMSLGPLILCAKQGAAPMTLGDNASPCLHGAPCTREQAGTRIASPRTVRSLITFWYTCWGTWLAGGPHDPATSLAYQTMSQTGTAALITTPGMSLLDRAAGLLVADLLRKGMTLGNAVDALCRAHSARYHDHADIAILFGDPEVRLPIDCPASELLNKDRAFRQFAARTGLNPYSTDTELPAITVSGAGQTVPDFVEALDFTRCVAIGSAALVPEVARAAAVLRDSCDAAWAAHLTMSGRSAAIGNGRIKPSIFPVRSLGALQDAWESYAESMFHLVGGYVRLQIDRFYCRERQRTREVWCPQCGGPAKHVWSRLTSASIASRVLVECISCATIFDGMGALRVSNVVVKSVAAVGSPLGVRVHWSVSVQDSLDLLQALPVRALAVLEPFDKGTCDLAATRGRDIIGDAHLHGDGTAAGILELGPLAIPGSTPRGLHHLNVLLLVGPLPAILRSHVAINVPTDSQCGPSGPERIV